MHGSLPKLALLRRGAKKTDNWGSQYFIVEDTNSLTTWEVEYITTYVGEWGIDVTLLFSQSQNNSRGINWNRNGDNDEDDDDGHDDVVVVVMMV